MNKVSFDQSSQNLVLKETQIADTSLIHFTIGTAAEKNKQNCTFLQILFLLFFWLKPHYTKTTGSQNNTTHLQVFKEKLSENTNHFMCHFSSKGWRMQTFKGLQNSPAFSHDPL